MYPVLSSNLYGIVSKNIETADIFLVSVCTAKLVINNFHLERKCISRPENVNIEYNTVHF
jgi:hypothetical protein